MVEEASVAVGWGLVVELVEVLVLLLCLAQALASAQGSAAAQGESSGAVPLGEALVVV